MQIQMDKLMELGAKFKEKRRSLGLEREEVAIKIKVSAKTLHALEEAIPDSLPQPVFAKGFARSYASALGFKTDEISELIAESFPVDFTDNVNPELSAAAREQSITINQTSNAKLMIIVVPVLLLIVGIIGYFVFKAFVSDSPAPQATPQQSVSQSRPAMVAPPQPVQPAPAPESTAPADEAPAEQAPAPAAGPAPAPAPAASEAPAARSLNLPPNQAPQSNARADSPIPGGMHRVVLFAKYECWIGAEFDEIGRRSFTLEAGQTFVLDFKNRLTLTLGNSGAIDMSYDSAPFDLGGRFKEARVLNFPPQ